MNYAKSSMNLAYGVNFIKLFWQKFMHQRHNGSQNFRQYANKGVNYAENFYKIGQSCQVHKTFFDRINYPSGIIRVKTLGNVLTDV